jgi:hypothetical protein
MATSGIGGIQEKFLACDWRRALWTVNGFFLLMTVVVAHWPGSGSADRQGVVQYLAQFTLAEEKNLAAYWEGWVFLLVSVLALERFFEAGEEAAYERQSWFGLAFLSAGLSLDELGSIHERAPFLFAPWGFSGGISANIPLAVPAALVLIVVLERMWRTGNRRRFWLTTGAFIAFASVALQEYLEHTVAWPLWALGLRFAVEEGTELLGIYLLLSAVAPTARPHAKSGSVACLVPAAKTFMQLRPAAAVLTIAGFIPLALLTDYVVEDATHRGIPAAWLPFVSLNLAAMAAWTYARQGGQYRRYFYCASVFAFIFSLDQILLFERVLDKDLIRGAAGSLMLPWMAALCLAIPILRTRANVLLLGALALLSPLLLFSSHLLAWLIVPLQSLGIYYVIASAPAAAEIGGVIPARTSNWDRSIE